MAGDLDIRERVLILPDSRARDAAAAAPATQRRVTHVYGSRVMVIDEPDDAAETSNGAAPSRRSATAATLRSLSMPEQLGLAAFDLRESAAYLDAKAARPRDGEEWDARGETHVSCMLPDDPAHDARALAMAGAPTSQRLTGSIAVGIIIVEGPNANLKFSAAERTKVVAEVQNGLSWMASQSPDGLTFKYDIKIVAVNVQPGPDTASGGQKEALWRDPAMQQLGFATGIGGVSAYVEKLRTTLGTSWTYCAFFTKYPLYHFAYASIGGPRLVMHYDNDGWGPDNIDRVFTHETGHIFGAPDEYASSGCNCGGSWGFYGKPNTNCASCAVSGGVDCLMKANTWNMCDQTPYHLGFPLVQQTYTGVWRAGTDAHALWVNASWNSFAAKWQQLAQQNLRLVDLKITRDGGAERFHGVWRQGTGGYYLWVNASQQSFVSKWQELSGKGMRLVDLEVQNVNGTLLYSGVWLPGSDGHFLWINADVNNFVAKWKQLAQQNLRLVDLKIVEVGGQQRFFGVWRSGSGGHYLWLNADWNNFVAKWKQLGAQGLRLVDIEINRTTQGVRYSGVWLPGTDGYYLWAGADWQHFRAKWEEAGAQGLRLIDLDVVPAGGPQSATANAEAMSYGGMAAALAAADEEEDGMGEVSDASSLDGEAGYGFGSIDGDDEALAATSGGLAGDGGGSIGLPGADSAGYAEAANGSDADGGGFGGGTVESEDDAAPGLEMEGMGGESLH